MRRNVSNPTPTSAKPAPKAVLDPVKTRFFYQGVFVLKRLQLNNKSKSPAKKSQTPEVRRR